jgi:pyridoxamine 5'-phosphate oxidase
MDIKDCTRFASEHPICFLATEDGGRPRVRPLLLWFADERGFYFMTMSPKALSDQLHHDPQVEVCFYNSAGELPAARSMRVTGAVEFLDDAELVHRVSEERAALEGLIERPLEPIAEVFRIASGEARFWTLDDILKERTLERFAF